MTRFAPHLQDREIRNPFPGLVRLEAMTGCTVTARIGSNESLPLVPEAVLTWLNGPGAELARLYPDPYATALRRKVARLQDVQEEEVLFDTGADSLILLVLRLFVSAGDVVVTTAGTYPTFNYFAQGVGADIHEVPYRDLVPDTAALAAAAHARRARLVYLANPDNPTGHVLDKEEIDHLRAALPSDTLLLLDEAYADFSGQNDTRILPGTVRLRTLSKAHALAGLRVGYMLAPAGIIAKADTIRPQFALSSLAQAVAGAVLDDPAFSAELIRQTLDLRAVLQEALENAGLTVLPSATNFLALVFEDSDTAARLQRTLLEAGIALHRPPHPAVSHLLRITAHPQALDPRVLSILATGARA